MREGSDPRGTASLSFVLLYFTVHYTVLETKGDRSKIGIAEDAKKFSVRRFFDLKQSVVETN